MSLAQAFSVYAPAAGILTSNALYISALPEVLRARSSGSLGAFNPLPSTIMVLSVLLWLNYALVVSNPWVLWSNLPGAVSVLLTFVVMLPLMGNDHKDLAACQVTPPPPTHRTCTSSAPCTSAPLPSACQLSLVGGVMATLGLWSWLVFSGAAAAMRASAIGYLASATFVILAASPLSTIKTVVASRDSESIYLPLTLAQCANTLLWTVYGVFAAKDIFVYGPNGIGLGLGLTQVLLKLLFPSKKTKK